jgi:hypothetical protein
MSCLVHIPMDVNQMNTCILHLFDCQPSRVETSSLELRGNDSGKLLVSTHFCT